MSKNSERIVYIVDTDTGATHEQKLLDGQQIRVINERSIDAFYRLRDGTLDIHRGQVYTKTYPEGMRIALSMGLSPSELSLMCAAQVFAIKFNIGLLVHENMVPVRSKDLIATACISERAYYQAMAGLIEKGILAKERQGRSDVFYANPFIFQCGNSVDMVLYRRFEKTEFALARQQYIVIRKKNKRKGG